MKFRFLDAALQELRSAASHYREIRPELGVAFHQSVHRAFDRLEMMPLSGALVWNPVRILRLKRFPYGLVYVPRPSEIVIVAVMHLHRRPGYWKRRLKDLGP